MCQTRFNMVPQNVIRYFKDKKIFIAGINCEDEKELTGRDIVPLFKKTFKKTILFDLRKNYFLYGREILNNKFIEILKNENPEYIFISLGYDELSVETLDAIKKICPKTKIISQCGDDNWRFEDWSRYFALFSDYYLTSEKNPSYFLEDGIKNIFFWYGVDTNFFKPLNLEKTQDVSFVGTPMVDRYNYLKFLLENKINLRIFSGGWGIYPDFKKIYGGPLTNEDYLKKINETKLNLCFSKGFLAAKKNNQFKARIFEVSACKSFLLLENYPDLKYYFKKNYNKIIFKTQEELLEKIKYYLENTKEREELTEYFYNEVLKNYSLEKQFEKLLKILFKEKNKIRNRGLPKLPEKIIEINEEDIKKGINFLKEKIKKVDYISFKKGDSMPSPYKDFFQIYSLKKSKKEISCCDYYIYSNKIGDYMHFMANRSFKTVSKKKYFFSFLDINQLAVTRKFFFKNINKFEKIFANQEGINMLNEDNTVFVSIPLIRIKTFKIKGGDIEKAFRLKFLDRLFPALKSKNPFLDEYFNNFLKEVFLDRNIFLLKCSFKTLLNKSNWYRLLGLRNAIT